jgi:hypothetical protein
LVSNFFIAEQVFSLIIDLLLHADIFFNKRINQPGFQRFHARTWRVTGQQQNDERREERGWYGSTMNDD